jgi:hypothetical protein
LVRVVRARRAIIARMALHSLSSEEVVGELLGRISGPRTANEIAEELRARIDGYERLPPELSETEVLDACLQNLRLWAHWVTTGAPPSGEQLAFLRAAVRARATEGVPLVDLLRAYRLGGRLGWQILRRHATPDEQEALLDAAEVLMEYIDTVSEAVTTAYFDQRDLLTSEEERRTRVLVGRIVGGGPLSADELVLAERLGVPVRTGYRPFAVAIPGGPPRRHAVLAAQLRARGQGLAVTEGDRVFGLAWRELSVEALDAGPDVCLATLGETRRAGLAAARDELELLIDHARRTGRSGLIAREDHLPELLLARSPRLARLLETRILGPLREGCQADLVRTLETFVACRFDRARTSAALHVHRNTLGYRLRRIEEAAGIDLGSPRDLACVYLCLAASGQSTKSRTPA